MLEVFFPEEGTKFKTYGHRSIKMDEDDFWLYQMYSWSFIPSGYMMAHERGSPRGCVMYLHKEIMDTQKTVDHKDRDTTNNQQSNLRICNQSLNCANRLKSLGMSSKYKGVHLNRGKWVAMIKVNQKGMYIGRFCIEEDAARAYDKEAIKYFGEFAILNFKK